MQISVVIPTYNRKWRLLALLENLNQSAYPVAEVIVVDAGNDKLVPNDYLNYPNLNIQTINTQPSVCLQRNTGIRAASSPWIFLCDDDIEVPVNYLQQLAGHVELHPSTGAISGLVLEQHNSVWKGGYDVTSTKDLIIRYIFGLSIWGNIQCRHYNPIVNRIKKHYADRGNHISKSGWPVITAFSGNFFMTPVYGLGASLIRKTWLEFSPYDETLGQHGIGDNYGVAVGFPNAGITVLNNAFVYHHHEQANRLQRPLQYYQRAMALDYFISTKKNLAHVKKRWLLWSLFGNLVISLLKKDKPLVKAAFKTLSHILWGRNPYKTQAAHAGNASGQLVLSAAVNLKT